MPILIALGLAIAFFVWRSWGLDQAEVAVSTRMNRLFRKRKCAWEATGSGTDNLREYKCLNCKVTAYSGGGKPPQECKRALGGSL